jgi:hypothetical protein
MNININFTIPDVQAFIAYILIGLIVALVIGVIAHLQSVFTYLAATIISALGAWLAVSIFRFQIGDGGSVTFLGIPLLEAFVGGLFFGLIAVLLMSRRRAVIVE